MKERRQSHEQQPKQPKKSYPEWVGDNLGSRKYFDIGVETIANLYSDIGDVIDPDIALRNLVKLRVVKSFLEVQAEIFGKISPQEINNPQFNIQAQLTEEAKNRGKIPQIATPLGMNPFGLESVDVAKTFSGNKKSQEGLLELLHEAHEQIREEAKKPAYPDEIAHSRIGRLIFDSAVNSYAKYNQDSDKYARYKARAITKAIFLNFHYFEKKDRAGDANMSVIDSIIDEADTRMYESSEKKQ